MVRGLQIYGLREELITYFKTGKLGTYALPLDETGSGMDHSAFAVAAVTIIGSPRCK